MEKKGILLAGGTGSRFFPVTKAVNKHFLPIYNKPMFFYPLSILMIGGIKKIQIVSDDESLQRFDKILSEMDLDVEFSYQSQNKPSGIADGILKSEKFLDKSDFVLILGDNFFFGQSLSTQIQQLMNKKNSIVTTKNNNPRDFGVVKYKNNKIIDIVEKPKKFISDVVVTGLYAYENKCIEIAKNLKPSNRGELEISDLNNYLIKNNLLEAVDLGRGTVWFDAGTPDDLIRVSQFVKLIQESSKFEIANLNEVNNEFIKKK